MNWFRWYHGTTKDPKWRLIAKLTGVPIGVVFNVWASLVENASESSDRGTIEGWKPEEIATVFDIETSEVEAVFQAMQGRTLDGNRLIAWEKRQPKREDDSRERVQRYRENVTHSNADVTQRNAVKHDVTLEEKRREESREKSKNMSAGADGGGPKYPSEFELFWQNSTKRGSKFEAGKAWAKLKPDDTLFKSIFRAMQEWRESEQWQDETKQPHISTWLRRRGWEEIIPRSKVKPKDRDFGVEPERPHLDHECRMCAEPHDWACTDRDCTLSFQVACPAFRARRQAPLGASP